MFAEVGGLVSYGNDLIDNYRRTAAYADRILKVAKPNELPVQALISSSSWSSISKPPGRLAFLSRCRFSSAPTMIE